MYPSYYALDGLQTDDVLNAVTDHVEEIKYIGDSFEPIVDPRIYSIERLPMAVYT